MDEFDFIKTYLAPLAGPEGLGLLDDAALLTPPPGCDLVLTKDTMVEGVHFPKGHYGGDTAEKLLRVNLSDLAAKGARPIGYLLSVAWPKGVEPKFMQGFATGLRDVQQAYVFHLFGGDTVSTTEPMVVTATLIGTVPEGQMVKRSGANVGDDIWVTGTIGDAFLGLKYVLGQDIIPVPDGDALWQWEEAYLRPEPRLLLRKLLRDCATAAIDVSDGLVADIGHLISASEVGCEVHALKVPFSLPTENWINSQAEPNKALADILTGGDDYEIVFAAPPKQRENIMIQSEILGVKMTKIGNCVVGDEFIFLDRDGQKITFEAKGYKHF